MISIIIPIYNAENVIERCVDSIVKQDYKDFEIILVNDGSTDNSLNVCNTLSKQDSRIKVFNKSNGGVSSARNLGLDKASGEWIAFVDADDYVSSNYLSAVQDSQADIILLESEFLNNDGSVYKKYSIPQLCSKTKDEYISFLSKNLHHPLMKVPWAKVIKAQSIGATRFKSGQAIGEDTLFVYQILRNCQSIEVKKDFYYYWYKNTESQAIKYKQTPKNAATFASNIFHAYLKLGFRSVDLESFLLNYFYRLCEKSNDFEIKSWFNNIDIREMEKYVNLNNPKALSYEYKLRRKNFIVYRLYIIKSNLSYWIKNRIKFDF